MNLFIYSSLDSGLQEKLRENLPDNWKLVFRTDVPKNEVNDAFKQADIIMGNPPAEWFQDVSENLVFWQLDSAGFEQYQQVSVKAPVANMGDFFARPCAETMVAGILAFYRGMPDLVKAQIKKQWQNKFIRSGLDLLGTKKVIILGAGTIGQATKQMLTGFGCQVKMTARRNPAADIHSYEELLSVLPETDVVINTLPGGAEKYVSAAFLQAMKPQSLYASVGRGSTTDETALITALKAGQLAGAVLDVTEKEPLPESSPLWEMDNVILTQHTGGGYVLEDQGKVEQFLRNVNRFRNKEDLQNLVDLSRGY